MKPTDSEDTTPNTNTEPIHTKPKKKHHWVLIGVLATLLLIVTIPVIIAGYFGFVPGVSSLMGASKAKDLGVTYTQQNFQDFIATTQSTLNDFTNAPVNPNNSSKKTVFSDPITVTNMTVSQEELTAAINESGWLWMPLDNTQVKITDGTVEISGNLQLDYITNFIGFIGGIGYGQSEIDQAVDWGKKLVNNAPVYIKAQGSVTNNQLQLTVQEAQIGRYSVPPEIAQTVLSTGTQNAINNTPYLDAQSATLTDGAIVFTGTHPSTIYVKKQ